MSNVISFCGNLGRDAELKTVGNSTVLNFSVGNSVGFGDRKQTVWFNCGLWGKRGESLEPYLTKGAKVFVSGEFSPREYKKRDGGDGVAMEVNVQTVDLIGSKNTSQEQPYTQPADSQPATAPAQQGQEDLPF